MKILGWIRVGDKAACGAPVVEGLANCTSHGRELSYEGALLACRKACRIGEGHFARTLPNGRKQPHHGHITVPGGCPLISTLNDIHGWTNESGAEIPEAFVLQNGEWRPAFSPRRHEDCEHDQHLIFEDQDGQALDGIPYRITDARGAVIEGKTDSEGRTGIVAGDEGDAIDWEVAGKSEE